MTRSSAIAAATMSASDADSAWLAASSRGDASAVELYAALGRVPTARPRS